jgi:opacity protein-like surface antigen
MEIGISLLALALLAPAATSHPHGLYVKLSGLWVSQVDSELEDPGGSPTTADLTFDSGYGVVAAIGQTFALDLPISLSVELEYAFRSAPADTFESPLVTLGAAGDYDSHSVMLNAIVAIDVADGFGFYGGIGVGTTVTVADLAVNLLGPIVEVPTEDDLTFTWQVLGGVQFAIGNHLLLYSGVRYFDAGQPDLDTFGSPNTSFAVEAGLRVYF